MASITLGLDHVRQDLAYAVRSLRRSPGFAAMVVATLALGVGANTALFSVADRLFLQTPAGVTDPGSLRRLYARSTFFGQPRIVSEIGYPQYLAVRQSIATRARTAAYMAPDSIHVGNADAAPDQGVYAAADLFPLLGVHAAMGRLFGPDDDRMGNAALVAVISYDSWQRRFGGDPHVIGRVVPIARQQYTIIGVTQRGFTGIDLEPVDVWLPLATYPSPVIAGEPWYESWRSFGQVRILARVRPHTPNEWLASAATVAFNRGEVANAPHAPESATFLVGPIQADRGPALPPKTDVAITTRLLGVALIVLLIACANVANLLLARADGRRREIAVRLALGVSPGRLIAQLLTEGMVLASIAGAAALLAGVWGAVALRHAILPATEARGPVLDWRMTAFAVGVALATGLVACLTPALRASRPDLTNSLKSGVRAGQAAEHSRFRASLILVQSALSVVLLVGAGLFVRSLSGARAIDVGFDADRLIYATVFFADSQGHYVDYFDQKHVVEVTTGLRQVAARMGRVSGVEAAALASAPPMRGFLQVDIFVDGGRMAPNVNGVPPTVNAVEAGYFQTTGVRLVRGRVFDASDNAGSPLVAVVNETAARAYWSGRDPIGQCLVIRLATEPCTRVVGVTHDAHLFTLVERPEANVIVPSAQEIGKGLLAYPDYLIVRAASAQRSAVIAALRRTVRDVFPTAEPPWIETSASEVHEQLSPWREGAWLFSVFGALALVVAAIGVYSVLAYSVSQRTHEMGVRMALGARNEHVMALVVREGVRVVLVGVVVGVAASLALGTVVASMLYDTSPHDPVVLAVVAAVLTIVGVAASAVPAWRASRTDPVVALRSD
ncbi:MAG TPA: ADOP family duplicated permease [Gemmatimonadaceae bacterium]